MGTVSLRGQDVGPQLGNFYLPSIRGQGETEERKGQESQQETNSKVFQRAAGASVLSIWLKKLLLGPFKGQVTVARRKVGISM